MNFVLGVLCLAAAAFDVASVKRSAEQKGIDYRGRVTVSPGRVSGRNVTLQDMIATAYQVQLVQVKPGSLKWVEAEEFDLEARGTGAPADQRVSLQELLAERFNLVLQRGTRDARGYALVVDKGGHDGRRRRETSSFTGRCNNSPISWAYRRPYRVRWILLSRRRRVIRLRW